MKKITAIILICSLLLCFAACGRSSRSNSVVTPQDSNQDPGQNIDQYSGEQDNNQQAVNPNGGRVLPGATIKYTPRDTVLDGFIGIYSVEELKAVSLNENGNYMLMADLDLSGEGNWTGISCREGIFDGNGHRITGLTSDQSGLFTGVKSVRNLTLDVDIRVSITKDTDPNEKQITIGGLTGVLYEHACDCTVNGTLTYVDDGEFSLETFFGEVYKKDGIASRLGGIAGSAGGAMIVRCTNNVNINVDLDKKANRGGGNDEFVTYCGGICGAYGRIEYCLNQGAVSVSHPADSQLSIDILAGGIVGNAADINGCRNEADITLNGYGSAGGIIGGTSITPDAWVTSCQNLGKITSHGEYSYAGGIQGSSCSSDIDKNRIEDCYNVGSVSGEGYEGGIIGFEGFLDRLGADIDIVNCAYWEQNDDGRSMNCSGIGAMRSGNVSMAKSDMADISNYSFSQMNRWMNLSGSYPVYFDFDM